MKYSVLVTILGAAYLWSSCSSAPATDDKQNAITVKVEQANRQAMGNCLVLPGTIEPVKQSVISTRIMGQIERVLVQEGQSVVAGQLLVSIRSNDIQAKEQQVTASINEATAAFDNAKADYNRFKVLHENGSATTKELDDVHTRFKMSEARLESARKMALEVTEMMRYAQIRAPYAGVITQLFLNNGDMASPGMPIVAIEGKSDYEVKFQIPESQIANVTVGRSVEVEVPALSLKVEASISEISPSRLHSGNQYLATARVANWNDASVKSGMFARVQMVHGEDLTFMIDSKYLIKKGQLVGVWSVTSDKKAILRWVRTGKVMDDKTEILSGLGEGDFWITESNGRLFNGATLNY